MTNLTPLQVTQVDDRIKTAFKIFKETGELQQALGRIEKLKESEGENGVPENAKNAWSVIAALPAVKCDIIKMVTTERNKAQMKEKNLVVFGVKETTDKAEIKEEILRILDVIQMKRHGSNAE